MCPTCFAYFVSPPCPVCSQQEEAAERSTSRVLQLVAEKEGEPEPVFGPPTPIETKELPPTVTTPVSPVVPASASHQEEIERLKSILKEKEQEIDEIKSVIDDVKIRLSRIS